MQKTECREFTACDMCDGEIFDREVTKPSLREHNWDLCHSCWEKLSPSLTFLTLIVGIEIPFSVSEDDTKVILRTTPV